MRWNSLNPHAITHTITNKQKRNEAHEIGNPLGTTLVYVWGPNLEIEI